MRKVLRHPVLHFAALGLALYLGQSAFEATGVLEAPKRVIHLDATTINDLRAQARRQGSAFKTLLQARINEEVLIDQALARDLDRHDPVARRRLLMNMRLGHPEAGETELLRRARALDMPRRDVLVRRRLIEYMQTTLSHGQPTARSPQVAPKRMRRLHLEQRFVGDTGDAGYRRAQALREALLRGDDSDNADAHLVGRQLRDVNAADIRRLLGEAVAEAAGRIEAGQWSEPVASAQGWHLLRRTPSEAQVRPDAAWAARAEHYRRHEVGRRAVLAQQLAALRDAYTVTLPDGFPGGTP